MIGLTAKQAELLAFIRSETAKNGYGPSYDEMREALGYRNRSTIFWLVNALHARGHIRKMATRHRSVELAGAAAEAAVATFYPIGREIGSPDVRPGPGRPVLVAIDGGRQS
jgi:SOS-response transcriptional repressor LexA